LEVIKIIKGMAHRSLPVIVSKARHREEKKGEAEIIKINLSHA